MGLGCMGLSRAYHPIPTEEEGINLIKQAYEKGVTFFDTADMYGPFVNEVLVGKALKVLPREKIQLATKFGNKFENGELVVRGSKEYVRQACEASLKRLDVDYIDLYYQHRVDTSVPIEETMHEMKKLVEEGKIKYVGLSEANPDTIQRAHAVHPISAVQIEWSLWTRDVEEDIVPLCRELGIGIVVYSPLGRGFFSGKATTEQLSTEDGRQIHPRFQQENLKKNKVFYERIAELGQKHGCTPGQLALAWVLHQGDNVVPIPGTSKVKNLEENLGALRLKLSDAELKEISDAVPVEEVAGSRYPDKYYKNTYKFVNTPPYQA
ncbi:hypothetical protein KP509_12G090200 [Ceratopteris richardii]|uniref:NADP-dependent oxidoreductase domain-containing protein n=3 Tax=Ceratopteris richardii TaxID=49495 RepID=A0A8T2TQP6_CERRI|nr:hypothetical protein KP509_12G090200 [Ceratopteris richardii]